MSHLDEAERIRIERLRAMTPEERWKAAHRLYWSARRLKAAAIRSEHPDWDEAQVEAEVRELFVRARS
ncbi:MAG: hypothetical protein AAF411_31405 [Myxococcota bacterium]